MNARKNTKKQDPKRHVCCYCGAKRIEKRMYKIPVIDPKANLIQGSFWACNWNTWNNGRKCAQSYLEREKSQYLQLAEKCESALNKLIRYNK